MLTTMLKMCNTVVMSTPAWIISQRKARRLCEHCGEPAKSEVTWADGVHSGTELLCDDCWTAKAAEVRP